MYHNRPWKNLEIKKNKRFNTSTYAYFNANKNTISFKLNIYYKFNLGIIWGNGYKLYYPRLMQDQHHQKT